MKALSQHKTSKLQPVAPRKSLDDLVLPEAVRDTFLRLKRERDRRTLLARNNLKPRNRLLFFGPPGNGKTASSEALANLLELDYLMANYAQLIDCYLGGTEKGVVELFDAVQGSACVVMFDEADSILSSRTTPQQGSDHARNNATNLLLQRLDQLSSEVVFVAATNRVEDLDRAAARRFDVAIEFSRPTFDEKIEFCKRIIPRYPILKGKCSAERIVKESGVESFAELEKEIIDVARQLIIGK